MLTASANDHLTVLRPAHESYPRPIQVTFALSEIQFLFKTIILVM